MPGKSLPELGSWLAGEQLPSCVADIQGSTSAYKFVVTPKRAFSFWGVLYGNSTMARLTTGYVVAWSSSPATLMLLLLRLLCDPNASWMPAKPIVVFCHKGGIFRHSCRHCRRATAGDGMEIPHGLARCNRITYVAPTKQRVARAA